jgi:hypothetical protein
LGVASLSGRTALGSGVAAAVAAAASCAHVQTICPRGASVARLVYGGGSEAEWCRRDTDGVRNGPDVRYYESGQKILEGGFVDGVQHGDWRYYWNTGEIWREERWNDGEMVVQTISPRSAKLTVAEREALGQTYSGIIKLAARDPILQRRQLEEEAHSFSDRYPGGQPRVLGRYDGNGTRWGVWWFWYPSGRLAREVEYEGGVRHRGFRDWYDTGRPRTDGNYFAGRKDGRWRRWDAAGRELGDEIYREGAPVAR